MTTIWVINAVTDGATIAPFSNLYGLKRTGWEQTPMYVSPYLAALFVLYTHPSTS